MKRNPLILALDVPSGSEALGLVEKLSGCVGVYKVGKELFTREGPSVVRAIRQLAGQVFLDLKFHDIPNTVAKAVSAAVDLDVQMITLHASGGMEMMKAAVQSAREASDRRGSPCPLLLAVTVLTSMDQAGLAAVGIDRPVEEQVVKLAELAVDSGIPGLVCSPLELPILRATLPQEIALVTPGIRTRSGGDDQKRVLSARQARDAGATWLVVGRPIYAAADPASAARKMLETLG